MAEENNFFNRLKQLFRQKAIITVDKKGNRNVVDTDDRQITNLSSLRDRYTKLQRSFYEQASGQMSMAYQQMRRDIFKDYDSMDRDPIITSALDIYADECTLKNEFGDILSINSDNQKVQDLLENLFYEILNIQHTLWPWTRNMCKYGDFFLGLEMAPGKGIVNVTPHSPYNTERLEGIEGEDPNVIKFKIEDDPNNKGEYENYEIAHFRLLSDTNWLPYGKSMIENGRHLWKQLSLMTDAMMIHRIMRAPEKRIFKIDIGNIPPTQVDNYMQKIINKMKKVPFQDKQTGDYNLKYNMQNITEDFYLPVRGSDSGTDIDNLAGLEYAAIDDIKLLEDKMFAALKIPRAYLGYEENVNGKATLAAEDVRFARTIERIQRTLLSELEKIAFIHLYSNGITDSEASNFELSLTNPSTIYEQEKVNLWSEKVRLASDIKDLKMISNEWIYKNVFNMHESEAIAEKGKIVYDQMDTYRYRMLEDEGNDPMSNNESDNEESIDDEHNMSGNEGRPREGGTYEKDKHPYGRDPLGDKERTSERSRTSENLKRVVTTMKTKRRLMNEVKNFKSMLDESNILDDEQNQ